MKKSQSFESALVFGFLMGLSHQLPGDISDYERQIDITALAFPANYRACAVPLLTGLGINRSSICKGSILEMILETLFFLANDKMGSTF